MCKLKLRLWHPCSKNIYGYNVAAFERTNCMFSLYHNMVNIRMCMQSGDDCVTVSHKLRLIWVECAASFGLRKGFTLVTFAFLILVQHILGTMFFVRSHDSAEHFKQTHTDSRLNCELCDGAAASDLFYLLNTCSPYPHYSCIKCSSHVYL